MHPVFASFGYALMAQLRPKMLFLTMLPFVAALLVWGVGLWLGLQPMIDWIQAWFVANDGFEISRNVLDWIGLETLTAVIVPLLAMWLLLPLMIVTALIFVGLMAMPVVTRFVSDRHFPGLERRKGGSFWGSVSISMSSFVLFALLWLVTLPLAAVPPLTFIVQPLLWGWLTYRVMAYDALSDHADESERKQLMRTHRWPLLAIGAITGVMGAAPTLLWFGGVVAAVLTVVLLPLLAAVAIWLYILVFVFSGLWFQYYCLDALAKQRQKEEGPHPGTLAISDKAG